MRDSINDFAWRRAISPVDLANDTPAVSQIIDTQGFNSLAFMLLTGSLADAGATFTVLVEHGDVSNLSDAAAVSDDQLIGTEALASFDQSHDNAARKIGYVGDKRYVRLTVTPSGNAAAALFSAGALLSKASIQPQSNP